MKYLLSNMESWLYSAVSKNLDYCKIEHLAAPESCFEDEQVHVIIGFHNMRNLTEIGQLCDVLRFFAKAKRIKRVTFLSSYGVYEPAKTPYKETSPLSPKNFVGLSAMMIEQTLLYLNGLTGLPADIIRMFNVYGPGQNAPYVVPLVLSQIVQHGRVFVGDSAKVRDFLYMTDFTDLSCRIITSENTGEVRIYNAGAGEATAIRELLNKSQEITAGKCDVIFDATRLKSEYDYDYAVADITRIKKELGWEPKVSLEEGLALTYQWILGRSGK